MTEKPESKYIIDLGKPPQVPDAMNGMTLDGIYRGGESASIERRQDGLYIDGKRVGFHFPKRLIEELEKEL